MLSAREINTEILSMIAALEGKEIINRAWLVTAMLAEHPLKRHRKKDPDEFSLTCRQGFISASVDAVLARLKFQDEGGDPDQTELELPPRPGFKHLRQLYPIKRDGAIMLVPLEQMTDDEIEAKVKTYRRASLSLDGHATELERYLTARQMSGAA